MLNAFDKIRINNIYKMLLEMSEGRFSFKIERHDIDDEIEALVILVNLMAEEIQQTLRYYSQLNSPESILQFVQMIFILDSKFQIIYVNEDVSKHLNKDKTEFLDNSFIKILSNKSKPDWEEIANNILININYQINKKLHFQYENDLTKEAICNITSIYDKADRNQFILVTSFQSKTQSQFIEDGLALRSKIQQKKTIQKKDKPNILKNEKDIKIIQNIHDYILQHLETPLSSLQILAHNFGTNEYKLKYGFKQLYNITVFKFLIDERLKKASLLIENTTLSMKRIAILTGFKSIPHFSKVFKNKYGCTPKTFRKISKSLN
ncbi:helix-turn-helix domain-containing protein [Aureibaculum sp. 2210JD6-5]|uniref:helix-turn-helix domain-containing protein n=1 Tax=Aureibaculum sp. 2210JD6-5 TaxID=3103957 RepID=UPI002AAD404A|nr:helix-turn-helix domain-containing protein [Aureibaculum sp. 2210JD6-5]MDY7396861.1 helix-turn-helix domain-containing protein [Aureibaculum sp. 2210JD6-5]